MKTIDWIEQKNNFEKIWERSQKFLSFSSKIRMISSFISQLNVFLFCRQMCIEYESQARCFNKNFMGSYELLPHYGGFLRR